MLAWLASWQNAPFLVSMLVGAGLVAMSAIGTHDHDLDGGHDVGHDGHAPSDVLGWLGFGKAPVAVLLQVLLLTFGSLGLLVNGLARDLGAGGPAVFAAAIVAASLGALGAVRVAAEVVARIAPPDGQTARQPGEFVGQIGVAASLISHAIGQVRVDAGPDTPPALLNAAVDPSHAEEIPRGTEVLLVGYDQDRGLYRVAPTPTDDLAGARHRARNASAALNS